MQNNFITFRPEIKDVKIKRVKLICDTYHVYGIRADIRQNCCGRQISCHKAGKLDDKGCEDKIIQFRHKVQGIQEILEADSKESKQYVQSFTEEETKETEEPFRDIFKGL